MKAKDLIVILKTIPGDSEVYISSDEEGNNFGDIQEVSCITDLTEKGNQVGNGVILFPHNSFQYEELLEREEEKVEKTQIEWISK